MNVWRINEWIDDKELGDILSSLNLVVNNSRYHNETADVQWCLLKNELIFHLTDPDVFNRILIAKALYRMGERQHSLKTINEILVHENLSCRMMALNVLRNFGYDVSSAERVTIGLIEQSHSS